MSAPGERRAWVRGAGAVTALGADWPTSVRALAAGHSAVAPVTRFDVTGFPSQVAAAIADLPGGEREDRRLALAERAAAEAWAAAGAPTGRLGVFIGAESGRATFATVLALSRAAGGGKQFDHARFGVDARALAPSVDAAAVSPGAVASALAGRYGAEGPARTVSLACASGSAAVVEAVRALRQGVCDVALAGGVGADVDPFMLAGFGLLGALTARGTSCPFDVRRDGFVVGEGAAMVVLAVDRAGARAEVAGVGRTLDAYHLTAPDPEGNGAVRAMRAALADARVEPGEVGYVQAHGTSTPLNDAVEAAALQRVLHGAGRARVSSVKGALGHWIAGAGALGLLCALEAVEHGVLLPTAGLREPDARCALQHVMGEAVRGLPVEIALANAFAFGGANSSLVVRRCA